jgi:hypothetical protein
LSDIERGGLSVEQGLDSKNAFRESYAAKEREAAEAAGLITEDGPPRNEQGQFTAAETEAPVVEGAPVVEENPADTLLAGKYKSVEDLERAYAELQQLNARQGSELGELRSAYDQRFAEIEQRVNTPQQQHRQITPDLIETNPGAATQLAYEQGDTVTLAAAYEQWSMENPAAASAWVSEQRANEREQQIRSEYDAKISALEQRFAPIQAQNAEAELARGVQSLPQEAQTFLADAATVQALASEFPTIGKTIVEGAPSERIEAIRALYDIHRGRTADTLTRTAQDVARETAAAAQAVRDDAYVASATSSEEQVKSPEQVEQDKAVAAFTRRQSTWDEAFVRPAGK